MVKNFSNLKNIKLHIWLTRSQLDKKLNTSKLKQIIDKLLKTKPRGNNIQRL